MVVADSAPSAPTVTGLSTSTAPTTGNTTVTITGTNFTHVEDVDFGGVAAANWVVLSSTSIQAVIPPHSAGTVAVSVATAGGTATLSSALTYSRRVWHRP